MADSFAIQSVNHTSTGTTSPSRRMNMRKPQARKLSDLQEEHKATVPDKECCVCHKRIEGYYGSHAEGGTCSGACERIKAKEEKYPGHTEEDFFRRLGK